MGVSVALLVASPVALAETTDAPYARDDIVEIRHARLPRRDRILGWTNDGAIVIRRTRCGYEDGSDAPFCHASLVVATAGAETVTTPLFRRGWDPGVTHFDVPYEMARDFIRAERKALAALPALTEGTPQARPFPVRLRTTDCGATLRSGGRRVATLARTDGCDGGDDFVRGAAIEAFEVSPDGAYVAVLVRLDFVSLDFYYDVDVVVVVTTASLA